MEAKHTPATPGPWSWAKCDGEIWIETSEGKAIAEVVPRVEAVADAKLISAAPDLLEALQLAMVELGWHVTQQHLNPETVTKIKQAIAKATQP